MTDGQSHFSCSRSFCRVLETAARRRQARSVCRFVRWTLLIYLCGVALLLALGRQVWMNGDIKTLILMIPPAIGALILCLMEITRVVCRIPELPDEADRPPYGDRGLTPGTGEKDRT